MRFALHLVLVVLVLSAGCVADAPGASTTAAPSSPTATPSTAQSGVTSTPVSPTTQSTTAPTPEPTTATLRSGVSCGDYLTVSFWYLGYDEFWSPSTVRVGYFVPENTSVLFVTYVDGDVAGSTYLNNSDAGGYQSDGATLRLGRSFDGTHTVQVVAYRDTNNSEAFERGIDDPCLFNGSLVQAGPEFVDFPEA
ncbi:hypothetical protein SAMN04487949_2003 [Halogranum gelatinilyticum]|uniref:Uncharacterized protein n=1 Tax=Halogranum gelatinilyticum TaxID=660521 RepID=A0A1G9U1H8_9EURY|nr:hypothetical protein [Halogranum gelatinilyticum]SDM53900.1 hypothetical protein SAMN04487949_2003 [Halogranum gelatinilyticum]